jgi:hypothetical protein
MTKNGSYSENIFLPFQEDNMLLLSWLVLRHKVSTRSSAVFSPTATARTFMKRKIYMDLVKTLSEQYMSLSYRKRTWRHCAVNERVKEGNRTRESIFDGTYHCQEARRN